MTVSSYPMRRLFFRYGIFSFLIIAVLSCFYSFYPLSTFYPDFDGSMRWAMNDIWMHQKTFLPKLHHTVGGYSFLKWPAPEGYMIRYAALTDLISKVVLGFYIFLLARNKSNDGLALATILFILFLTFFNLEILIVAVCLFAIVEQYFSKSYFRFVPGLIIVSIGLFIKTSISIPCLVLFFSYILYLGIKKEFVLVSKNLITLVVLFFIHSYIIYGNLIGGLRYIWNDFYMVQSYSKDTSLYLENNFFYLAISVVSLLVIPFWIRNKQTTFVYSISALYLFSSWKYVIGRQDYEHYFYWYFVVILFFGVLVLINEKKDRSIVGLCCLLSLTFFATNAKIFSPEKNIEIALPCADRFVRLVWKTENVNKEFQTRTKQVQQNRTLSPEIVARIGMKKVDVFPWELTILDKYQLNYQPRPFLQSSLFGLTGDKNDAAHFSSNAAPPFLLWHHSGWNYNGLLAHDEKYLPNESALAFQAIVTHYSLIDSVHDNFSLWMQKGREYKTTTSLVQSSLNRWVIPPIYDSSTAFVFAKVPIAYTFLQKCTSFIYKPLFFSIDYKFMDGSIEHHKISLTSLNNGFLVQPYFYNQNLSYKSIHSFSIQCINAPNKEIYPITFTKTNYK